MIIQWLNDDYTKIEWWSYNDWMKIWLQSLLLLILTAIWSYDDYMMIARWLNDDRTMIEWWSYNDWMMIVQWLNDD